jgi:NAD(P)H-flavin reductase
LPYEPGQSVTVQTDLRPRLWRTYSIANAPTGDGVLELHVRARDGGPVSGALVRHTSVGSVLRLGPPLGLMVLDPESDRDLLLVGIGTGMAPLKALVQQVARLEIPRRVDFFVGARSADGFYDLPALRELEQQHPWLHVVLVATRQEDPQGAVERGAMVDVVLSRGPWSSRDVYLSGARDDVRALKEALVQARVAEKRIKVEEFTPSSWSPRDAEGAQSA